MKFLRDNNYNFVGCDIEFKREYTENLEEQGLSKMNLPYSLPFPDNHFDFVVSDQVFEHPRLQEASK